VKEIFTPGSVRGAARKGRPYRDRVVIGLQKRTLPASVAHPHPNPLPRGGRGDWSRLRLRSIWLTRMRVRVAPRVQCIPYRMDDRFGVAQYLVVPETHNIDPGLAQYICPVFVLFSLLGLGVLPAVYLDSQSPLRTVEIYDVRRKRFLSGELETTQSTASQ
jgi:hypothetical protein